MTALLISLAVIALLVVIGFIMYNKLVKLRNGKDEALANIATQEQRRYDLIGNLIETVKGYAKHESETLKAIVEARQTVNEATPNVEALENINNAMQSVRSGFKVLVEDYPELKASSNFLALQEELATTENKISYARANFNSRVRDYNTAIGTVPMNLVAKMGKFTPETMFAVSTEEAKQPIKVQF